MLISTVEDAVKFMNPLYFEKNVDYVIDSLMTGKVIAINEASGFHAGNLDEYAEVVEQESSRYPQLAV
jgi:hypothetical protein